MNKIPLFRVREGGQGWERLLHDAETRDSPPLIPSSRRRKEGTCVSLSPSLSSVKWTAAVEELFPKAWSSRLSLSNLSLSQVKGRGFSRVS